jgi:hypothetical protein
MLIIAGATTRVKRSGQIGNSVNLGGVVTARTVEMGAGSCRESPHGSALSACRTTANGPPCWAGRRQAVCSVELGPIVGVVEIAATRLG